ncbi:MAG: DNA cytosine methyltransferase [Methylacidiphilales bacterium]|nr:DNA cytosine methyltransferase [Candidatus Methylacidiphilales bacterium]
MRSTTKKILKGVSLFSSAGIGEAFFKDIGVRIIVANELLEDRAKLYSKLYSDTKMIAGDILDKKIFKSILEHSGNNVDFLISTPPCQGMSMAGKNRDQKTMLNDQRNHLVFKIIDFINIKKPKYILIENVPNFLKLKLPFKNNLLTLEQILSSLYGKDYEIEARVMDTSEYGVPQKRKRAIIKMHKKGLQWAWPTKEKSKTVKEAIGHLPSLEANQKSKLSWHFARKHADNHILWMKNTPTGKSAFENKKYFPKKDNGETIKSYMTTYRRIKWDEPSPTITMRNDAISSQLNVHPGRKLKDGTYSDARVLTPLELMILSSLPEKWNVPQDTPEILIRKCLGESVPPLLLKKVLSGIK